MTVVSVQKTTMRPQEMQAGNYLTDDDTSSVVSWKLRCTNR